MTRTDWQSEPPRPPRAPLSHAECNWLGTLIVCAVVLICTAVVVWAVLRVVGPLVLPPYCTR